MVFSKSLYPVLFFIVCLLGSQSISAQEPMPGATPQRVSGGVVVRDTLAADSIVKIRTQSTIFRDTLPLSRVAAISVGVPGFAQLYNNQYWKIPVLYGGVGAFTYLTIGANKKYQQYKRRYEFLLTEYHAMDSYERNPDNLGRYLTGQPNRYKEEFLHTQMDPIRTQMNKYNTQRTIYFAGATLTYLYFLADGVLHYPHQTTTVKRATTLAMMFPGAGQLYNKSYWKVPIVVGVFATMGYLIDWNNRLYQRYRIAYNQYPYNEFQYWNSPPSEASIQSRRDDARRNRDLCIILTAGAYIVSIIEAHVDAHMKNFDISNDLSMRVEPTLMDMSGYYSYQNSGYPGMGLALKLNF